MISVVTGGSGSGKSEYAEKLAVKQGGRLIYIATMQPFGSEARERISRHREMRSGKGFETIEAFTAAQCAEAEVTQNSVVLLECVSNLVANEMFSVGGDYMRSVKECLITLSGRCGHLIAVTNEIFSDGLMYDDETIRYIKAMAEINRFLFSAADSVTEVVYSIPVLVKGGCLY